MVDEGVVGLGVKGVVVAHQSWQREFATIGVDVERVDEGS